jgi:DNA-binding NarL/FixJ family response regulator
MSIRILVADDHPVVRGGLCAELGKQPDFEIVGQAGNGEEAVRLVQELGPDVAILDVAMPVLDGTEACRQIAKTCPDVKVVALSTFAQSRRVCEMLKAGASAYLRKTCQFDDIVRAIHAVVAGRKYLDPDIAGSLVEYVQHDASGEGGGHADLSPKEVEVLRLIAKGLNAKEIAAQLHITPVTVNTHRRHIMDKLGVNSVAEITKYAIREGLTPLDE